MGYNKNSDYKFVSHNLASKAMSAKVSTSEKEINFGPWNVPEETNTRDKGFGEFGI